MSFYTSLSGLTAAQTDMNSISNNLANVATNGFKKSRTDFADVMASNASTSPTMMIGSGVVVKGNVQQFGQGNMIQTTSGLDLAISGDGFFAVRPDPNSTTVNYTRNGAFSIDSNHFITDAQGNQLLAYPVDGSGAVVAGGLDQAVGVQIPATSGTASPTGAVGMTLNLPNSATPPTNGTFDRFDPASYNYSTQNTVYDADGNPQTMVTYFKRDTAATTPASATDWTAYSYIGDQPMTVSGNNAVTVSFDASGNMTAPGAAATFDPITPPGASGAQTIALTLGTASKQSGSPYSVSARSADGSAVGQFEGVTVGDDGVIKASFSNGDIKALGKVVLANFADPSGLRQLGDSTWASTGVSGQPVLGAAGDSGFGSLLTSTIEGSNVDITEELVNLIAAQRNFQANSKALDTQSQIQQTIFQIQS
jgi:flagellar hook protein FlgE